MKNIDFSSKHNIYIMDEHGSIQPMDEPYFRSEKIAPGTWLIRSDGDFSYLLEGDAEGLVIDSGYGCGNIREYCETLIGKPVRWIANTHHHFDHTANNAYFDRAYMSAETAKYATTPFSSFDGIDFPRDYPKVILSDGDIIPLAGREITAISIPDHATGSLAFLDRKERILFSGDEFMQRGKTLHGSVAHWKVCLEHLNEYRGDFNVLYGGAGRLETTLIDLELAAVNRILAGEEGQKVTTQIPKGRPVEDPEGLGRTIYMRYAPHPEDFHPPVASDTTRVLAQDGHPVTYDINRITEEECAGS